MCWMKTGHVSGIILSIFLVILSYLETLLLSYAKFTTSLWSRFHCDKIWKCTNRSDFAVISLQIHRQSKSNTRPHIRPHNIVAEVTNGCKMFAITETNMLTLNCSFESMTCVYQSSIIIDAPQPLRLRPSAKNRMKCLYIGTYKFIIMW